MVLTLVDQQKKIADPRNRNRTDVTLREGIITIVRRSIDANGDAENLDDERRILPSLYKDEKDDTSLDIAMPTLAFGWRR